MDEYVPVHVIKCVCGFVYCDDVHDRCPKCGSERWAEKLGAFYEAR